MIRLWILALAIGLTMVVVILSLAALLTTGWPAGEVL